jgi:D-sedoheptulose 7-phosphate isomerase
MAVNGETELRALGAPGDVLLAIAVGPPTPALLAAVQAAMAKEMTVVALTGSDAGGLAERLSESDVHIAVPHERAARIHETHTLVLHCLCDAVDLQLLGEQEPT